MNMTETGILFIRFKEGIPFGELQETINTIYKSNEDRIQGMQFIMPRTEQIFHEMKTKLMKEAQPCK